MNLLNTLSKFMRRTRGNTVIEFALILPVLLLFLGGVFEISMYALLNNKLVRLAGTMSNLISMQNINLTTLKAIIATAPDIMEPLTYRGKGNVIVSLIYNDGQTTDPSKMLISWQQGDEPSVVSLFGKPGEKPVGLPNNITVTNDQALVVTEVSYQYAPYFFSGIVPPQILYKTSIYVPRSGDMVTLLTP